MKQRLLTVAWAAPIVLGAVFCTHSVPVGILVALAALWCCRELANLQERYWISISGSLLLAITALVDRYPHFILHAINLGLFLLGILASVKWFKHKTLGDLAGLWIAAPMSSAFLLHGGDTHRWLFDVHTPLLIAILPVWAGDTAAIFAGKAFGKRLLAPTISPKKTVEGAIANFLAATLFGYLVGLWIFAKNPATGPVDSSWIAPSILCGIAAGTLGQLGDLFESWLKRQAGAKDSGSILPGHGGLLDRMDSMLFCFAAASVILTAYGFAR